MPFIVRIPAVCRAFPFPVTSATRSRFGGPASHHRRCTPRACRPRRPDAPRARAGRESLERRRGRSPPVAQRSRDLCRAVDRRSRPHRSPSAPCTEHRCPESVTTGHKRLRRIQRDDSIHRRSPCRSSRRRAITPSRGSTDRPAVRAPASSPPTPLDPLDPTSQLTDKIDRPLPPEQAPGPPSARRPLLRFDTPISRNPRWARLTACISRPALFAFSRCMHVTPGVTTSRQ
jgi:hypothetical protein